VARLIRQGSLSPWAALGISVCPLCGAGHGEAERTDGVYLWPEDLPHYIREHDVRPPVSVIRDIVSSMRPQKTEDWWKSLVNDDQDHKGRDDEWWTRRVSKDWWKTATLDS
jgi:hypothetical protein